MRSTAFPPLEAATGAGIAAASVADDEPLTLPAAWRPPARPPLPIVAAVVPVVGAVALWLVTGSVYSLWFALLGPVIAAATVLDARRAARKDGRRAAAEAAQARDAVASAVAARHTGERAQLWSAASRCRPPRRGRRRHLARRSRRMRSWSARGSVTSIVRVTGGDGDPDAAELRRRAGAVGGCPGHACRSRPGSPWSAAKRSPPRCSGRWCCSCAWRSRPAICASWARSARRWSGSRRCRIAAQPAGRRSR